MKDDVQLVEAYFRDLRDIRQTGGGVKEESYYGSLENLLNCVGKSPKPQVRCIIELMNRGAGQMVTHHLLGNFKSGGYLWKDTAVKL